MGTRPVFFEFQTTHLILDVKCVNWSTDNSINLLTDKGVYIFSDAGKRSTDSTALFSRKYFIENYEQPNFLPIHERLQKIMPSFESNNGKLLAYNEINLSKIFSTYYQKYSAALWSPHTEYFGCLLLLTTFDHRATIYRHLQNEWTQLIDISQYLYDKLYDENSKGDFTQLLNTMHLMSIDQACWGNVRNDGETEIIHLFCTTKNGFLLLFQISVRNEIHTFELLNQWNLGVGRLASLTFFANYLVIGTMSGQVITVNIGHNLEILLSDGFVMCPRAYPWPECDDMPVYRVLTKHVNGKVVLLFAKSTFLISCCIIEFFIAKKPLLSIQDIHVEKALYHMYCTGLCHIGPDKCLISSADDQLLEATLRLPDGRCVDQKKYDFDAFYNSFTPLGLDSSPNHQLTCLAQSITKYYDHLSIKEPTKIVVFPCHSFSSLVESITSLLNGTHTSCSLRQFMDLFQSLRGYYNSGKHWVPEELLNFDPGRDGISQYAHGTLRLKVLRYIGLIILSSASAKGLDDTIPRIEETINRIEDTITVIHIGDVCLSLQDSLNKKQRTSIYNMKCWFKIISEDAKFADFSAANIRSENGDKSTLIRIKEMALEEIDELCPICEKVVYCTNRKEGVCENGHKFSRCVNSLLLLNLSTVKMKRCLQCENYAYICPSVWKDSWNCLFCS